MVEQERRREAIHANLMLYGDPKTNTAFHEGPMEEALQRFRSTVAIDIFSLLGLDKCFLDVGCGEGTVVGALKNAGFRHATGLDLSLKRLSDTRLKHPGPFYLAGLVQQLPFASNAIAGVSAFEIYEHVPPEDGPVMLAEIYRVLEPGGKLILSTLNRKSLARRIMSSASTVEAHFNEVAYNQLQDNIRQAGFTIQEVRGVGLVPLMWRLQKAVPFPVIQDWNVQAGAKFPSIASATLIIAQKPLRDGP